MTIEFGGETLTKCGGKVLPFVTQWDKNAQNIAVSGDDALPKFLVLGYDDTAGVGLLTCREPATASFAGPGIFNPRWHGMTRWTPPTFDSTSYTLVFTKAPSAGGGTYAEDITIIPNRRDCRSLAELRSSFHDFAVNLRGLSVYLQESIAYGTLHIDRPGTVSRLMDTDGTTVLTDWSQTTKAKGADEILEIALWGSPDTHVAGVTTLNAPSRITKITGPGTCTLTLTPGDTGNLTIRRGALTKSNHGGAAAWPYDHAIGVHTAVPVINAGTGSTHWQCTTAGILPRPSSSGDSAELSGGPYTLSVSLVGTRGSATRTVTINIEADAYSLCSNADMALIAETSGSGVDLKGKQVLISEHSGESFSEFAFLRVRGLNGKNGASFTGSPSPLAAQNESHRCILRYADEEPANDHRRPWLGRWAFYGARFVTARGLRFIQYGLPTVATTGGKIITWPIHVSVGAIDVWQSPTDFIFDDLKVLGSLDRRCCWATAFQWTAPNTYLNRADFRYIINGIALGAIGSQALQVTDLRICGFCSNAIFLSAPGTNFLLDRYILYNAIQTEDDKGDHVDHIQLGSTNESSYVNARMRRGFIMYGEPPVDSDGFYIGNPYGQTGFCNDMTFNSTGTGVSFGGSPPAKLVVPTPTVEPIFEHNFIECYLRQGIWLSEISGRGVANFNTIWAREQNPPERHTIQLPYTDLNNAEIRPAAQAEAGNPSNTYQMDFELRHNMAPLFVTPGDFGGTHTLEMNKSTGRVDPEDFLEATPITDWYDSTFDELYAELVAFATPLVGGIAEQTTGPDTGKYYGAYFPDGTLNTGAVFNAPPVSSVSTLLSASQIPSNGSVVVTYILDAAAVDDVTITPSAVSLTGAFDDATVTIGVGETTGETIFRPSAAGSGTIGGADDAGLTGPNSVALEVINAGALAFSFPNQVLINSENELIISADGPVGSDVTITLAALAHVTMSTLTPVIPSGSTQVSVDVVITRAGTYSITGTDDGGFGGPDAKSVKCVGGKKVLVKI